MTAGEVMLIKVLDKGALEEKGEVVVKRFVFLPVNPYSVSFSIPKVYSEVRVSTPLRVVIQDWGTGLIEITVNAMTGRILPFAKAFERIKKEYQDITYEDLISFATSDEVEFLIGKDVLSRVETLGKHLLAVPATEDQFRKKVVSEDFLRFSRFRYLMMKLLEDIYMRFDANEDVMVLEWMKGIYYGIMTNFEYRITVESLWNIRYSFSFKAFPSFFETMDVKEGVVV
jgi:hypothetical protein